ncbi:hypothetical protein GE061_003189 [Apolygus lucorum]|uniref:Uncharacterized protein n=1 Tax=Apolygus lucorum TaxID=248454 RepID=A0A6A4JKF6_APOLU|nr:hypothetical protein GE061_003189 [Apolygus lucorum]
MFRPFKIRFPFSPSFFCGDDGLRELLWQKRLYLSDKGNADADDDIKKGGPSGTRGGGDERGGGAGAIRSAGGSMGKMAAAQEESYFHNGSQQKARDAIVKVLRMDMACGPPATLPSESCSFGLGKLAVFQEDDYFERKTMEELEKLHDEMKNELESAGKTAEVERDRDKRVEKKMKELAGHLKEIIEEGKKK